MNYRLQASRICSKRPIAVITPVEHSFMLLLGERDGRIRMYGKKTLQKGGLNSLTGTKLLVTLPFSACEVTMCMWTCNVQGFS